MAEVHLDNQPTQEIAGLDALSREALVERWVSLFTTSPPKRLTLDLLVRGIAYEIQAQDQGGLKVSERKALMTLAAGRDDPAPKVLKAGTRLYRTWRGVTEEVLVLDGGYSWRGTNYASLSEVARAITGTRWSGPRFFGITG